MSEQFSLKYRPKTLDQMVVGNPDVLIKAEAMYKKAQAILITGASGTGKTTLGLILNRMLNGDRYKSALIEMNCAIETGIDDIRELQTRLEFMPSGVKHFVLMDEVHAVSGKAASSLLKLIETPPHKNIVFVLCTDQPYKLQARLINRCRPLQIEPADDKELGLYLYNVASKLKLDVDRIELKKLCRKIARAANNVPRQAMQYLEDAVDLIAAGRDPGEAAKIAAKADDTSVDKFVGNVLIMLYTVAAGRAKPDEGILYLLNNMPSDAMGLLMRLQSTNYYGMTMVKGGKFQWQGKVMVEALKAKKLTPSLKSMLSVSNKLNELRELLREPATDPVILVGATIASLTYELATMSKRD